VPTGFLYGHLNETDLFVNWRIILKCIFKEQDEGAWIDLAQDRNKWLVFMNTLMNILLP
jgi:hypothetical protein